MDIRMTGIALALAVGGVAVAATAHSARQESPRLPTMAIFTGSTHVHTGAENDHGGDDSEAADVFKAAKDSNFDFVVLTEHAGPTGPKDPAGYYADAEAAAAAATQDGEFVGLAGYEYSENSSDGDSDSGHLTGFGSSGFVDASASGMDFGAFMSYLAGQASSRDVFGGFNHPVASGHPASATSLLTPERRSVMALTETSNKLKYDAADERAYYQAMVAELDRGWRVSPTCGLDSHVLFGLRQNETSTKKPCRTGILAPSLTRANVLEAIRERRTYSTRDIDLRLKYSANAAWMGSIIGTPSTVSFDISVEDPDTDDAGDAIRRIEIIGDGGAVLASTDTNSHSVDWTPEVAAENNSYMFVRVFNGEHTEHVAVAAPIWLE